MALDQQPGSRQPAAARCNIGEQQWSANMGAPNTTPARTWRFAVSLAGA